MSSPLRVCRSYLLALSAPLHLLLPLGYASGLLSIHRFFVFVFLPASLYCLNGLKHLRADPGFLYLSKPCWHEAASFWGVLYGWHTKDGVEGQRGLNIKIYITKLNV